MLDNLRTHQKFVATPIPPLALVAALAAGRIPTLTGGARAGRLNTLDIWRR
jgi:hypothetical protein